MTYHVMSRGNARMPIFEDDRDYERYLELLERCLRRFGVRCVGYCLIVNHVHLILQAGDLPISRMMQQLNSTYAQWFNRRHHRVGHVFQGRFKALLVETSSYLTRLLRYVLWNPVAAGRAKAPDEWRWSSYRATAGVDPCPGFLHVEEIWGELAAPNEVAGRAQFAEYMAQSTETELPSRSLILGSQQFAERCRSLLSVHRRTRDFARSERFADRPPLPQLFHGLADRLRLAAVARRAFLEHAYTLREIGAVLLRPPATVWFWIHRVAGEPSRPAPLPERPPA
jgi:REP element-mobilizing transposase RayT